VIDECVLRWSATGDRQRGPFRLSIFSPGISFGRFAWLSGLTRRPEASTRRIVCQQECWKRTSFTSTPSFRARYSRIVAESEKWSAGFELIGKQSGLARPPDPFLRSVSLFLTCAELKEFLCYAPKFSRSIRTLAGNKDLGERFLFETGISTSLR